MVSEEYVEYLKEAKNQFFLSKNGETLANYLIKKCKKISDDDILEYAFYISMFYDIFSKTDEEKEELYNEQDISKDVINTTLSLKKKYDNIKWIKRPSMIMTITEDSVILNESLTNLLSEVNCYLNEAKKMRKNQFMGNDYYNQEDNEDDIIKLIVGISGEDIVMAFQYSITDVNEFSFYKLDNGKAKMDSSDVRFFKSKMDSKYCGRYLFSVDGELNILVGKKLPFPIIIKKETNKNE